jgi:membrane-bound lytic murein transglycosylase A
VGLGLLSAEPAAGQRLLPATRAEVSCDDLDAPSLARAIEAELPALLSRTERTMRIGSRRVSPAEYARTTLRPLLALAQAGPVALCAGLRERFSLYQTARYHGAHVTAYYHPIVSGSRTRTGPYRVPLYRRPADPALVGLVTADILDGALDGRGLELVFVESLPIALLVHIEGSVTVQLAEGGEINLTPDGHNGHPYQNPYKLARHDGIIPKDFKPRPGPAEGSPGPAVMSTSRAFFETRPDLLRSYWAKNPHFVFFKETPSRGTGRFGELIPGRSAAVDLSSVPLGAALLLRSELAVAQAGVLGPGHAPLSRLLLAQDTGAAIRGPGRLDLFVGWGEQAAYAAAHTSRSGELYVLCATTPERTGKARRKRAR